MSPELDKALCEKYPEIFRDRYGDMRKTAMCWGFECGDGWYDLINTLCSSITHHLKYNAAPDTPPVIAEQVKEKFGTLRFYYRGGDDKIDAFVQFAEYFSGKICEVCGKPGRLNEGGWLKTTCEDHRIDP